jgi:hypothetical protein
MRDRGVRLGVILALGLLVVGNSRQIALAASPDPVIGLGKQPHTSQGFDASFPQCPRPLPSAPFAFAIVGVTEGIAFSTNDCLHEQFVWAQQGTNAAPGLYLNLNAVMYASSIQAMSGPKGKCTRADGVCQAYNYGYNTARAAYDYATEQEATTQMWWLDVEWMNYWTYSTVLNDLTIQGAVDFVVSKESGVGIYSTQLQWNRIAGRRFIPKLPAKTSLPVWLASDESSSAAAAEYCSPDNAFAGGTVWYVQYRGANIDQDYDCLNQD